MPVVAAWVLLGGIAIGIDPVVSRPPSLVYTGFSVDALPRIESGLAATDEHETWRVERCDPDRLGDALADTDGTPVAALVGYPVSLLLELSESGLLVNLSAMPSGADAALSNLDRGILTVWIDPIAIAYLGDPDNVVPPTWIPDSFEALADPEYEGRLRLERPTPWNALGLLVTSLGLARGGPERADDLLSRLDGNRVGEYLDNASTVALRLRAGEMSVLGLRAIRILAYERQLPLRAHAPSLRAVSQLIGVAAASDAGARALTRWLDAPTACALGRSESLVPVTAAAAPDDLEPWMEPHRVVFTGEAERMGMEPAFARAAVDRYWNDVAGEFGRREAAFSEVFDALGVVVIAGVLFWALRRRDVDSDFDEAV